MSLSRMIEPVFKWAAKRYQAAVATELKKYGLRYDDLLDPLEDLDVNEAINRLPQEVVDGRTERLRRAMDLSMKHTYLPNDLQAKQTPFEHYLQDTLAKVREENNERYSVGSNRVYERHLP
ncbi:hypothetical protein BSKO_12797 [Bryopsis sp. KO-2023]|nr:hypothetical protein BSKO_12797 [Bryopsis sp. KO-2023]